MQQFNEPCGLTPAGAPLNPGGYMHKIQIKSTIAAALSQAGWKVVPDLDKEISYGVATKDFDTAVGVKTAIAYVEPSGPNGLKLIGSYYSEGNNTLSTTWYTLGLDTSLEDIAAGAADYAAKVDAIVAKTYAMRLMRFRAE